MQGLISIIMNSHFSILGTLKTVPEKDRHIAGREILFSGYTKKTRPGKKKMVHRNNTQKESYTAKQRDDFD